MTEHSMQASLTLRPSGMWVPHIDDAFAELVLDRPAALKYENIRGRLAPAVVKILGPMMALAGVHLTERKRLEFFEALLHGKYFVAGGAALGDYAEQEIMQHFFRETAIVAAPAGLDVHLHTAATSDANSTGTEVTGGGYAAQVVDNTAGWDAPGATGGATANAAAINYGTASGNLGTISHVSITMPSSANRIVHGALASSKTVNNGDTYQFNTGDLDVAIA
jgi:hypothetical protein